eukprot:4465699-Amphidinium_carterae.1
MKAISVDSVSQCYIWIHTDLHGKADMMAALWGKSGLTAMAKAIPFALWAKNQTSLMKLLTP